MGCQSKAPLQVGIGYIGTQNWWPYIVVKTYTNASSTGIITLRYCEVNLLATVPVQNILLTKWTSFIRCVKLDFLSFDLVGVVEGYFAASARTTSAQFLMNSCLMMSECVKNVSTDWMVICARRVTSRF